MASGTQLTRNASAFAVKHYENFESDTTKDFEMMEEAEKVIEYMKNAPRPIRNDSSASLSSLASTTSAISDVSTAATTPHHSRNGSKVDGEGGDNLTTHSPTQRLEDVKLTHEKEVKEDPWRKEYPKPAEDIDVAACLARKKLAGTPFEKLQQARAAMTPAQRSAYDADKKANEEARWKAWEHERFLETIKNLRTGGFAGEMAKAKVVRRPATEMNGWGHYVEFDDEKGGWKTMEGQGWDVKERFKLQAPPSQQVAKAEAKREADIQKALRY